MEKSRVSHVSMGSPSKIGQFEQLQEDKKYILKRLHYLFIVYSARASRHAYRQMAQKSFMELMEDLYLSKQVRLIKNSDPWKNLVTLYHSKGKKIGMNYQSFLKILPGISELFLHSESNQDHLKTLLKHMMIVYEDKVARDIQQKYVEFDNTFTQQSVQYLQKLAPSLYTLYKIYFPEEISKVSQTSHPSQALFEIFDRVVLLFKEFEIFPKIISSSQLYLVYLEIATKVTQNAFSWADQKYRKRDRLSSFGFSKYLQMLVRVAMVGINRLRDVEDPEWWSSHQKQCLKALFEYMEGIRTKAKNSRFQHVRFSFILYDQYKLQKEKWKSLAIDPQLKPIASHGDFFEMFQKMKL